MEPLKIRIAVGLGAATLDADSFAAVVGALGPLGFDSLWISDVLTGPGPDPLIALAIAAQLDPSLKLGTTLLLPGRNQLRLAKALASLDVFTRGRLLLTFVPGLGHGPERDAVGVPTRERAAVIEHALPRLRRGRHAWPGNPVAVCEPDQPVRGGCARMARATASTDRPKASSRTGRSE